MKVFDFALIIDDDHVNNLICENILTKTRTARNVKSILDIKNALAFLQTANQLPDLILLDLRFPGAEANAWDFLEQYPKILSAEKQAQIALFILTSSIAKVDMNQVSKYGFVKGFLSKPLTDKSMKYIFEALGV